MSVDVIAIDGPAASGKSTVAALLSKRLGIPYVNTGNMYRALTLFAIQNGVTCAEECTEALFSRLLPQVKLEYKAGTDGSFALFLNGRDPGTALRSPQVAALVSPVAALPIVREYLKKCQRAFAARGRVVMEGRDIGTAIFPDAAHKFFVTASPETRARRRLAQSGETFDGATLQSVAADIAQRDYIDSHRPIAPLRQSDDSILVDTTEMTIEEVVNLLTEKVETNGLS